MPSYDYQCDSCGCEFEIIQKITEDPLTVCPKCAGKVHRLLHPSPFILKGSGWYVTDYARKDKGASANSGSQTDSGKQGSEKASGEKKTNEEGKGAKDTGDAAAAKTDSVPAR